MKRTEIILEEKEPEAEHYWTNYQVESTWNGNDMICIHTVPNYGGPHEMLGDTCCCHPRLDYYEESNRCHIVHNAYDHMKIVETK